ncbi:hypothetical protein BU24DRAFT_492141 [Aaosphaeria arxii CBS 175.79]|uniref:Uncharacterized protein n=1 Tax=Aaosphaeria arxii CBS 175.79 TaxID=1450172 RepID=A0A6A5XSS6_9PLEO|nr:uncharacterized protein BU24DRAFT_492141 [Aaosphaeria arxii CBS 175.79]KAF2015959.1 hypothetical protein BU24DRAFT_492141 [Aaosphaeria arxii CBS 175.79]
MPRAPRPPHRDLCIHPADMLPTSDEDEDEEDEPRGGTRTRRKLPINNLSVVWEVSVPREFEELYNSEQGHINIWSGIDNNFDIREKLHDEFRWLRVGNKSIDIDAYTQETSDHALLVIYINDFFRDGRDFVVYIKGKRNVSNMLAGVFARKAFSGHCFATPIVINNEAEIFSKAKAFSGYETVSRSDTKGVPWKYYYHTARAAFENLVFRKDSHGGGESEQEMAQIREKVQSLTGIKKYAIKKGKQPVVETDRHFGDGKKPGMDTEEIILRGLHMPVKEVDA